MIEYQQIHDAEATLARLDAAVEAAEERLASAGTFASAAEHRHHMAIQACAASVIDWSAPVANRAQIELTEAIKVRLEADRLFCAARQNLAEQRRIRRETTECLATIATAPETLPAPADLPGSRPVSAAPVGAHPERHVRRWLGWG